MDGALPFARRSRRLLVWTAASVASELCLLLVDALLRPDPQGPVFWLCGLIVSAAIGFCFGLIALCFDSLSSALRRLVCRRLRQRAEPSFAQRWRRGWWSLTAMLTAIGPAHWLFSGARVRRSWLAHAMPPLLVMVIGAAVWLLLALAQYALTASSRRRRAIMLSLAVLAVLLGAIDMTVLVALYGPLHAALQVAVTTLLSVAFLLEFGAGRVGDRPRITALAAAALGALGTTVLIVPFSRAAVFRALSPSYRDPVYLGRLLLYTETSVTWLENPWLASTHSVAAVRVQQLLDQYGIADASIDPRWLRPAVRVPPPVTLQQPDVLFFYVDTLRLDTATDAQLMPNLAALSRESLSFTRAYAAGSDTGVSLPSIVSGRYGVAPNPGNFLRRAEALGYQTELVIPRSAREYLQYRYPDFHLQREELIADYEQGRKVWGYGGHLPTAPRIVDRAIERIKQPHARPELLWLFNFDVHNWRELDGDQVALMANRFHVQQVGPIWRYRAIAAAVDAELARLIQALRDNGRWDKTLLVFISDHGEGLGERGFWVHSYYLWESLLRVPLVLHIPGVAPRTVDAPVSLVDLDPTLLSLIDPNYAPAAIEAGQSLFSAGSARRNPICFSSTLGGQPARIGILSQDAQSKLIVHLDSALPQLRDLTHADADFTDCALERPLQTSTLLSALVRSPIFPRTN